MKNGNPTNCSKTAFRFALLTEYAVQKRYKLKSRLEYLNEVIGFLQKAELELATTLRGSMDKSLYSDCMDLCIKAVLYRASLKRDLCLYDSLNDLCDALYEAYSKGSFAFSITQLNDYLYKYTSTLFKDKTLFKEKDYRCFVGRYKQYIETRDFVVDKSTEAMDAKAKMQKYRKTDRYKKTYRQYKAKPKTVCRNAYLKDAIPNEYSISARIAVYKKRKEVLTKYGNSPEVATMIKEYDDFIERCKYYRSRAIHQFASLWTKDSASLIDKYIKTK